MMARRSTKARLESVEMKVQEDPDPDLSFLGEWSSQAKRGSWYVDRYTGLMYDEKGNPAKWANGNEVDTDMTPGSRNEHRYFIFGSNHVPNPGAAWSHVSAAERNRVIKEYGSLRDADIRYAINDWDQAERISDGDIEVVGVKAVATVVTPQGTVQKIKSPGIWGIIGPDEAYLDEIFKEEREVLLADLRSMGMKV